MADDNSGLKFMSPAAIAVIALAAIVLTGIAVLAGYSEVLRTPTTAESTAVTLAANGSEALYGTTGQFPFLTALSTCVNDTTGDVLTAANFSITSTSVRGGVVALSADAGLFSGAAVNCTTTTYRADSTGQAAADSFITGLTIFGTFMAVIVLALVGMIIVSLFKKGGN